MRKGRRIKEQYCPKKKKSVVEEDSRGKISIKTTG